MPTRADVNPFLITRTMNRHFLAIAAVASATLCSLAVGYSVGTRRGEAAAASQRAAMAGVRQPAMAPPANPPDFQPRGGQTAKPRTREEVSRFLADLKSRLLQSGGASGSLRIGLNDPVAAEALGTLSLDEVRTAMDLVNEMPPGIDRSGFSMALMQRWAKEDPMGALGYFESHRDAAGPFGTLWLAAIVMPWLESDAPTAAREFARVLGSEQDEILQGSISNAVFMVAEKLRESDPGAALSYVDSLPEWARDSARSAVSKEVHGDRRGEFLNRLRDLPEGPEKTAWQRAAATAMAPVDAPAASQWIDSLGLPESESLATTRAVFEKWIGHDPRSAVEWAAARVPAEEKPGLMAQAVDRWAAREPNDCGRWLGSQPAGPELDLPFASFARAVAAKDPDSAQAWADQITDAGLRAQCQEDIRTRKQR